MFKDAKAWINENLISALEPSSTSKSSKGYSEKFFTGKRTTEGRWLYGRAGEAVAFTSVAVTLYINAFLAV